VVCGGRAAPAAAAVPSPRPAAGHGAPSALATRCQRADPAGRWQPGELADGQRGGDRRHARHGRFPPVGPGRRSMGVRCKP
jgi:hypothetical protein